MDPKIAITLPERVPLMIFSTALVFPNTIQPMRIFEPRYREMLAWALEHDRMFCLAQLRPGSNDADSEDDFFHTAGVGLIRACVGQTDGTSQLLLQGLVRVKLSACAREGPFWTAAISAMAEYGHTDAEIASLMDEVRTLSLASAAQLGEVPMEFAQHLEQMKDPGVLADTIANAMVRSPQHRQKLIEEDDVADRLRRLRTILKADLAL